MARRENRYPEERSTGRGRRNSSDRYSSQNDRYSNRRQSDRDSYRKQNDRDSHRRSSGRILSISNLLAAMVGFLLILSLSVVITLNCRQLYYFDIRYQQIENRIGLSEEVIRRNYDHLIDYNLVTKHINTLEFPDFPMSEHGRIHFAEVKRIFIAFQILSVVTALLMIAIFVMKARERDFGWMKLTSILTLVVPVILGVLAAVNWNAFFLKFHDLFFANNYWIFNPTVDPVINILPDAYFLHCAVLIFVLMVVGCLIFHFLYKLFNRR